MPKLPIYTANPIQSAASGGRRASGEDLGPADVSGGVHALQRAGEGVIQSVEEDESRKAIVANAQIRAEGVKRLDEAVTSGEDTSKIQQDIQDKLAQVSENFQTKRGVETAELHAADTGRILGHEANQIEVTRANVNARVDGIKIVNALGAQVARDPSSLPRIEGDVDAFLATLSKVSPEHKAALGLGWKQDLNMAAAISSARLDPDGTIRAVEGGAYNLRPEQIATVVNKAHEEVRGRRTEEAYQRAEARQAAHDKDDAAFGAQVTQIMAGKGSWRAIDSDPDLLPRTKVVLANIMETRANRAERPVRPNPALFNSLRERIDLPASDPRRLTDTGEVWNHYAKGDGITEAMAQNLEKRMRDNRSEGGQKWSAAESEIIRNLKPQLDKSTLLTIDAGGGDRVQAFTVHLRDKAEEYKKEKKDPYLLLKPGTPDYIGNDIPLFQSGAQRTQGDMARKVDKALAPKEPAKRRSLDDIFGAKP